MRVDAEVARRPDAEELEAAQRADQVAEVRLACRRRRSRGSQSTAATKAGIASSARPATNTPAFGSSALWPAQKDDRGHERSGHEPAPLPARLRTQTSAAHAAASGNAARARLLVLERPRQRAPRSARASSAAGELLDPAPERVAEQERRLGRDEDRERTQRPRRDDAAPAPRRARARASPPATAR